MSAADSESLKLASWWYATGEWLVIIGVIVEGFEILWRHRCRSKSGTVTEPWFSAKNSAIESNLVKRVGDIGWFILVIGLVIALKAHFRITDITGRENRRLTVQLDSTTKSAASNELEVAVLTSNNLVLRSNVVALEAAVQWRTITPTQETNLINVLKPLAQADLMGNKLVNVNVPFATDFEAFSYAKRIAEVLRKCGLDANFNPQNLFSRPNAAIPVGLEFFVKRDRLPSPLAVAIIYSFQTNGIPMQRTAMSSPPEEGDNILTIWVWHKPPEK
jgi:hypothetical protein